MEDGEMTIKTLKFNGLDPVCIITYQGTDYYLGKNRVLMTKKFDFVRQHFDQLPEPVQKEYLLWKLSL